MAYPKNQSLSTYQTPCLDQCKKKENLTQRHLHQTADHPQLHLLTHPDPLLQHCHQAPHSQTQAVHHHSLCLLDFMDLLNKNTKSWVLIRKDVVFYNPRNGTQNHNLAALRCPPAFSAHSSIIGLFQWLDNF